MTTLTSWSTIAERKQKAMLADLSWTDLLLIFYILIKHFLFDLWRWSENVWKRRKNKTQHYIFVVLYLFELELEFIKTTLVYC